MSASRARADKPVARNTYRLSALVDAWLSAEAERLGVSKNAVVDMKLAAAMNAETQVFTPEQEAEIERMIKETMDRREDAIKRGLRS